MMTIDPRDYIIDNDFECVIPRHHWSVTDENWAVTSDTKVAPSSVESEVVSQLLKQQKRLGTVTEWLPGYRAELDEVTRRRLRHLSTEEVNKVGAVGKAVRLRMNLEPKRDGRRKCRLILQGFREPKSWEPCVFTHANGLRVAVWVDDIIVRGSKQMTEQFYA